MPIYKITIDTDASPDREAGLQKVVEDYNDSIALPPDSELPPELGTPLTPEQYLQRVLDIAVDSYTKVFLKAETNVIAVKFERADASTRTAVKDALAAIDGSGGGGSVQFQPRAISK